MGDFKQISVQEVHDLMDRQVPMTLVDIRDANAFAQGHIDHALRVSDDNMQDFLSKADKNTALICYCYRGTSSQRAAAFFVQQGFAQVYSIEGGFEAWRESYGEASA